MLSNVILRAAARRDRKCEGHVFAIQASSLFFLSVCSCMVPHITRRLCSTKARYQRAHRHDPRPSSLSRLQNENGVVVSSPRKIEFQQRAPYRALDYALGGSHGTLGLHSSSRAHTAHTQELRADGSENAPGQPSDDTPWTKQAQIALASSKLLMCAPHNKLFPFLPNMGFCVISLLGNITLS